MCNHVENAFDSGEDATDNDGDSDDEFHDAVSHGHEILAPAMSKFDVEKMASERNYPEALPTLSSPHRVRNMSQAVCSLAESDPSNLPDFASTVFTQMQRLHTILADIEEPGCVGMKSPIRLGALITNLFAQPKKLAAVSDCPH